MKKCLLLILVFSPIVLVGQKYIAEKSKITFFSDAAVEDITASNAASASILNSETGEIAFSIPNKEFIFSKSLMQEHFNEKYMETEKFPKSTFQGKITGFDMKGSGAQPAKATGKLTIHGVTKDIDVPGTVEVKGNTVILISKFIIKLEDYSIARPQLLWQNLAEEVEVSIDFTFKPYEKK